MEGAAIRPLARGDEFGSKLFVESALQRGDLLRCPFRNAWFLFVERVRDAAILVARSESSRMILAGT